jgi:hypothetical protein
MRLREKMLVLCSARYMIAMLCAFGALALVSHVSPVTSQNQTTCEWTELNHLKMPRALYEAAAVYDPNTRAVYVYGGLDSGKNVSAELYQLILKPDLSSGSWIIVTPNVPTVQPDFQKPGPPAQIPTPITSPRWGHVGVSRTVGDRTYVYWIGGSKIYSDTLKPYDRLEIGLYETTGKNWQTAKIASAGQESFPPVQDHGAVVFRSEGKTFALVQGGRLNKETVAKNTYLIELPDQPTPEALPAPRINQSREDVNVFGHTIVYVYDDDPDHGRALLFGGSKKEGSPYDPFGKRKTYRVWQYVPKPGWSQSTQWTEFKPFAPTPLPIGRPWTPGPAPTSRPTATPPEPKDLPANRFDHAAAFSGKYDAMIIYGGRTEEGSVDETWALVLRDPLAPGWIDLGAKSPGKLSGAMMVYDNVTESVLLLGGQLANGTISDKVFVLHGCQNLPTGTPSPIMRDTPLPPRSPTATATATVTATPTSTWTVTASVTPRGSLTPTSAGSQAPAYLPRVERNDTVTPTLIPTSAPTPTSSPTPCKEKELTFEPNNTFDEADKNHLLHQDCILKGTLDSRSDGDIFRIKVESVGNMDIELTNIPRGQDYDLFLYDSSRQRLAYSARSNTAGEQITYRVTTTGYYYIGLTPASSGSKEEYKLKWTWKPSTK